MFPQAPLAPSTLVLAIDPGKVMNRVWVSDGEGPVTPPLSMPVSRAGIEDLERTMDEHAAGHGEVLIAIEATGSCISRGRRSSSDGIQGPCGVEIAAPRRLISLPTSRGPASRPHAFHRAHKPRRSIASGPIADGKTGA